MVASDVLPKPETTCPAGHFTVNNPSTGAVAGYAPNASADDLDQAVRKVIIKDRPIADSTAAKDMMNSEII